MRWTVHGERNIYESFWLNLAMVDVEIPGERRFEHHVIRVTAHAAGTVVMDPDLGVLLLWRHRFITDTWGWEIPAGRIDEGETAIEAAAREAYEETGWRAGPLRPLFTYHPYNGVADAGFHIFAADGATHVGPPTDTSESSKIEWVSWERLPGEVTSGRVLDGLSLTALLWVLARLDPQSRG